MNQLASLLACLLLFVPRAEGWLGIQLRGDSPRIIEVIPESPAFKAGVKPGDVILALDGARWTTSDAFIATMRASKVGQRVTLRLERDGKEIEIAVTLAERPPQSGVPLAPADPDEVQRPGAPPAAPAEVAPTPAAARGYLGAGCEQGDEGVAITRVVDDSPAAAAGLKAGDVVVAWGGQAIGKLQQLDERMQQSRSGQTVVLTVRRGDARREVKVTLGARPEAAAALREEAPRARAPRAATPPTTAPRTDTPRTDAPRTRTPRVERAPEPAGPVRAGDVELPFRTDYKEAEKEARSKHQPLFVVYGASWDGASQAQRRALATPALQDLLAAYVCVYVDAATNRDLLAANRIADLPAVEVRRDGELRWRHVGFLPVDELRPSLREHRGERAGAPAGNPGPAVGTTAPAAPPPAPGAPTEVQAAPNPVSPAPEDALQQELKELRREVEELRRLLEELRKARGGE